MVRLIGLSLVIAYNLTIIVGTAYLVNQHNWNPAWFVVSLLCLVSYKS